MDDFQWYQALIPLISGGAMGAIITAVITARRNRVQPVGQRLEFLPIFKNTLGSSSIRAQISVSDGQNDRTYQNLHMCRIQIANRGNKDMSEFTFGVTLSVGDSVVYVETLQSDRHHTIQQLAPASLIDPKSEMDFTLRPFNRRDTYILELFIVTPQGNEEPGNIQFSSAEPVTFVVTPTMSEIFTSVAVEAIQVGPLAIWFRK